MKTRIPFFCLQSFCLFITALHAAEPIANSIGMKLVRIEPGTFTMGQDGPPIAGNGNMATHHTEFRSADWDENPAHRVTITQPFSMSVTEVTLGQFRKFDPDFRKGKGADDEAVDAITWTRAVASCEWLSKKEGRMYRLPTEAEWESADAIERPTAPLRETVPGLRIETRAYPDHAATEWQFPLRAPEAGESPLYEKLKSADFEIAFPAESKVRLPWSKGSHSEPGDFEPKTHPLVAGETFALESFGGRSSDGVMPYFNLASDGGGIIVAIGWTGDWKASFELQDTGRVRVTERHHPLRRRVQRLWQDCRHQVART